MHFSSVESDDEKKQEEKSKQKSNQKDSLLKSKIEKEKEKKDPFLCSEMDFSPFNNVGMDSLPFLKPHFIDIDGDKIPELIAGSKYGDLKLYKKVIKNGKQRWKYEEDYFKGINVSSFSSPAASDIDGDGKVEIAVGVGGFSKESGKVIFFKNYGTNDKPIWKEMTLSSVIRVGNDATPAFLDVNGDGKPDLIVGNSVGKLALFINHSKAEKVVFKEEKGAFKNIKFGMYANISVAKYKAKSFIAVGNDMGKLFLLEKNVKNKFYKWNLTRLKISVKNFAAPSFIMNKESLDLVVSDSNGKLSYFKNIDFKKWRYFEDEFKGKIYAGFACSPSVANIKGKDYLIIGNIHGELKLFELNLSGASKWIQRAGFFKGIKLKGFARGIFTNWNNKVILVTGEQDGTVKAFRNNGSLVYPKWSEIKNFFSGIKVSGHSAPAVFDIDGDGKWELLVGDFTGEVKIFKVAYIKNNLPHWGKMPAFANIKAGNYAVPSIFKYGNNVFLFVGEGDGKIKIFKTDFKEEKITAFKDIGFLNGVRVNSHNSPYVYSENGRFLFTVGDYDGNLKVFACPEFLKDNLKTALTLKITN